MYRTQGGGIPAQTWERHVSLIQEKRTELRYDKPQLEGTMRDLILLHPTDSVCVAARDLSAGATVELPDGRLRLLDDVIKGTRSPGRQSSLARRS